MRKLAGVTLTLAVAAVVIAPAISSAGTSGPTYTPKNCVKPAIEPGKIVIDCAGGNFFIKKANYRYYNQSEAGGKGKALVNSCMPNCGAGNFDRYSVKFKLIKPKPGDCGGERVPFFHKIEVSWKRDRPAGIGKREKYALTCVP